MVVTHDFSPIQSPRAVRWTALCREFAANGHDVHVVTSPSGASASSADADGFVSHRVGGPVTRFRQQVAASAPPRAADPRSSRNWLREIHDATWKQLYWPDYAFLWRRPALVAARGLMRERAFDALVTVSPPFTGHRIGLPLRRSYRHLRWLADFGDPFSIETLSAPNNLGLYARRNRRAEQEIIDRADVLTTVTEPLRARWADAFASARAKMHVIPPMHVAAASSRDPFLPATSKRRLVYTGALHPGGRPDALLRLFERLQEATGEAWELHFVGETWSVREDFFPYAERFGRDLFLHGPRPRAMALRAVEEADVVVNLGYDSPIAAPSKLFDYFASGRPILNVSRVWPDAAAPYLERYPAAFTLSAGEAASESPRWSELLEFLETARTVAPPAWLVEHSPEAVAKQYESLLTRPRREDRPLGRASGSLVR